MSRIETIAKEKRKELETKNRYKFKTEYNKTSKDIYSEGINGDNFGKEPSSISSGSSLRLNTALTKVLGTT
jgi:hypothetical protein